MTEIPVRMLTESIITLLTEAYPGPPDHTATWFIDNDPDSGILGILRLLRPYADEKISAYRVGRGVNMAGTDRAELIRAV
jgi:hypothetical protein